MPLQMNLDALLKRFGRDVTYNNGQIIRGIYDEQPINSGGIDSIMEVLKIKESDLPDLAADDEFELYVGESQNTYKAKEFTPQRSGFLLIELELQP